MASDLVIKLNELRRQELIHLYGTAGSKHESYANGRLDAVEECIKLVREDEKKHGFA